MTVPGHIILSAALVAVVATGTSARADDNKDQKDDKNQKTDAVPLPQPVLAIEGARREGPIARQWFDTAVTYTHLGAATSADTADAFSLQLEAGPKPIDGKVGFIAGDALGWLAKYAMRVRWTHVMLHGGSTREGPLTIALQRFFEPASLNVPTLIHVHAGLEATVSTPWLDNRRGAPPVAYQKLYAVDTELSHNGYSVRPLGAYLRADVFVCRNLFFETGLSPEGFVPTESERTTEFGLRWHVAFGFNLACSGDPESWLQPLAISFEVRGRGRLDSEDGAPHHNALDSIALQYHLSERFVINVFGSRSTGVPLDRYFAVGGRLQVGLGKR